MNWITLLLLGAGLLVGCQAVSENNPDEILTFNFYQEAYGTWYIDLPEYPGPKGNLAMVAGADEMLDFLAEGGNRVTLQMSEKPFEGALQLNRTRLGEPGGGAYYKPVNHTIQSVWLCDVTLFALGKFPETIYFKAIY